jgi:tRNA(Ile)-lysidine synthase
MRSSSGSSTRAPRPAAEGARAAAPLAARELDALLAPFAGAPLIALAVSGGPDSLALLDAVDRWRRRRGKRPGVLVLTVDHALRAGSAGEAAMVAEVAAARGLPARILKRRGKRPAGDIEAAARVARYRLLIDAAREAGASHLLVAHHLDDVAETFLLRLQRGAGVFGLAAMRAALDLGGGLALARPFLKVPRARLAATVRAAGLAAVDDPMNRDPRFARARLRRLLAGTGDAGLAGAGIDAAAIAATAFRLAKTADAIDAAVTGLFNSSLNVDGLAIARLDPAAFGAAPPDIQRRALARLIQGIGGEDYPPRFERLEALRQSLAAETAESRLKRTLGGVVIEARPGAAILLYRELGRKPPCSVRPAPDFRGSWDHRFSVVLAGRPPSGLALEPLGEARRRALGLRIPGIPAAAIAALPAVVVRGRILAIPALGHGILPAGLSVDVSLRQRLMRPPLFPDFTSR